MTPNKAMWLDNLIFYEANEVHPAVNGTAARFVVSLNHAGGKAWVSRCAMIGNGGNAGLSMSGPSAHVTGAFHMLTCFGRVDLVEYTVLTDGRLMRMAGVVRWC